MASKSAQQEPEMAEVVEEALDTLDKTLDRLKALYEQFFLGIQKQPPQFLHTDVERKLRDLAQLQIRNTALRYRFMTLQQKFGSYNTYWRRTLREIEAGRYHRSLSKITRQAAATGAEIPYEILVSMPKRMREQVRRDREAAIALQHRRDAEGSADEAELLTLAPLDDEDGAGFIHEPTDLRHQALRAQGGAYVLDDSASDMDLDAYFRAVEAEETASPSPPPQVVDVQFPDFIAVRSPPAERPPTGQPVPERPSSGQPPASTSPPPGLPKLPAVAPSQQAKPNPIPPGSSSAQPAAAVENMMGPFPREAPSRPGSAAGPPARPPTVPPPLPPSRPQTRPPPLPRPQTQPSPLPARPPESKPPPGMTEADLDALYVKYVKAKQMVGEATGPHSFSKLMKTINAQAPKIMEQYRAKGVDFTVVIKDNQVIIRAKPKM